MGVEMTAFWYALTGFCIYLAGFLTASIMASGKMQDLELENDLLRLNERSGR